MVVAAAAPVTAGAVQDSKFVRQHGMSRPHYPGFSWSEPCTNGVRDRVGKIDVKTGCGQQYNTFGTSVIDPFQVEETLRYTVSAF
jgi:hypothetical protein